MAKTPEEILEEARKLIGTETEPVPGRYPVEYEPIRRYCHMSGDANPLYLDPEYAKKTKFGDVPCPPLAIGMFGSQGMFPPGAFSRLPNIPTAGNVVINLTTEWEILKPVKVGDLISSRERIADVYIKSTKFDPKSFWTVTERVYSNQNGEDVAIGRNIGLRYRSKMQLEEAGEA
jgi:acyl dehydratase